MANRDGVTIDIVGNIIIAKDGKEGELEGLTPQDIDIIKKNMFMAENKDGDKALVVQVDY